MANRRIYLVDSENVSCEWLALCPQLGSRDNIVLFYTEKSPFISYPNLVRILPYLEKLELVQCYMGPNALDFQMCTYLGAKLAKPTKTEYFIVSNDRGYLPVVKFWKDRGRLISQINHAGLMRIASENERKVAAKERIQPTSAVQKASPTVLEAVRHVVQQEESKTEHTPKTEKLSVDHLAMPVPQKVVSKMVKSQENEMHPTEPQPEEPKPNSVPASHNGSTTQEEKSTPTETPPTNQPVKSTPKRTTRKSSVQKKPRSAVSHRTHPEPVNAVPVPEETSVEQFVTAPRPKKRTQKKGPVKKTEAPVVSHPKNEEIPQIQPESERETVEQFVTAPKPEKKTVKKSERKPVPSKSKKETVAKPTKEKSKKNAKPNLSKAEMNRMIKTVIGNQLPLKAHSIGKISDVLLEMPSEKLTLVHAGLVKAFDAQMGRDIYRVLKPELPRIFQSIHHPTPKNKSRSSAS